MWPNELGKCNIICNYKKSKQNYSKYILCFISPKLVKRGQNLLQVKLNPMLVDVLNAGVVKLK